MPIMRPSTKHIQTPIGLSPSIPNTKVCELSPSSSRITTTTKITTAKITLRSPNTARRNWFQIAWRTALTARCQASNRSCAAPSPPGGTPSAARHQARPVATATVLGTYRLAARSVPPNAIPVVPCYRFLASPLGLKRPQMYNVSIYYKS